MQSNPTLPAPVVNKFDRTMYPYYVKSHAVCSLLLACTFAADHKPLYYEVMTPVNDDIVWTDLQLDNYSVHQFALNDITDVVFFNNNGTLEARRVPITRINSEVYDDLLRVDSAIYNSLVDTMRRQGKLYRFALAVSLSTIVAIIGGVLWKRSH